MFIYFFNIGLVYELFYVYYTYANKCARSILLTPVQYFSFLCILFACTSRAFINNMSTRNVRASFVIRVRPFHAVERTHTYYHPHATPKAHNFHSHRFVHPPSPRRRPIDNQRATMMTPCRFARLSLCGSSSFRAGCRDR